MVGGAAVEKGYADRLGADGHGEDLIEAANIAVLLMSNLH
jgi:methanogenic corrinoid protein MtbC1